MTELLQRTIGRGDEMLILSLLIIMGLVFARLAVKIRLPQITGYIIAGIIIGNPFLHLISHRNFESLHNVNLIALGLMSITIGAHLNFHKLQNSGKRVMGVVLFESLFAFGLVFVSLLYFLKDNMPLALLIASIAIATAPAATVATVKEVKAKGLLVNTLMPVVAINNVLCIVAFGFFATMIELNTGSRGVNGGVLAWAMSREIVLAAVLGIIAGFLLKYFAEKNIHAKGQVLTLVFLTVLAVTGMSKMLKINHMLPCMAIGLVITNTSHYRSTILTIFEEIEYLIMIIFFALAGAHIDVNSLGTAGIIGVVYFFARNAGKITGGYLGGFLAGAPQRVYRYVGAGLLPQAGVAIGLVILAGGIQGLRPVIDFLTTLVLAVVAMNELAGPLATKWALYKSGDAGQDRPKLIEFLLEDYILANMKAKTKEEAIRELISFFVKSHRATPGLEKEILASVFEREQLASTGIGNGVAIPHGVISEGPIIWGALGVSKQGIDFDSIDDEPVHLIILIVTPKNHKADMHLAVLSEIAKLLSDGSVLEQVFDAGSAAAICDIFREKEQKNFNYFLDYGHDAG